MGGSSGSALNRSDIGGYPSLQVDDLGVCREPDLVERWTELAAVTALMRSHEGNPARRGAARRRSAPWQLSPQ